MLKINHIFKSYFTGEKRQDVLKDVSFSLPEKGLFFIVGKSGSGKSTLLNLIGGLDRPDQGSILIDGKDIVKMKEKELAAYRARKIGFVFQEYNLLSGMTVEENLLLATDRKVDDKEIDGLLSKVGLLSFKKKKVELLSGGEKQRVALVRAMLKDCRIILSDEPTGSLDSENAENMFSLLKEVSKDRLVLVVTHDRESAEKYKDGIVEIKDGKVIDTLPEFEKRDVSYKEEKELKLSFRKRIRLAFSLMRKRPARMIVMLLISIFSFSLFGISTSIVTSTPEETVIKTMYNLQTKEYSISKKEGSFTDEDISLLKGWNAINSNSMFFNSELIEMQYRDVDDRERSYYASIIQLENNNFSYNNIDLYCGKVPQTSDEVAIPLFYFEKYKQFGYKYCVRDERSNKDIVIESFDINEPTDLLGTKIKYGDKTKTVTGIFDTHYNPEIYQEHDVPQESGYGSFHFVLCSYHGNDIFETAIYTPEKPDTNPKGVFIRLTGDYKRDLELFTKIRHYKTIIHTNAFDFPSYDLYFDTFSFREFHAVEDITDFISPNLSKIMFLLSGILLIVTISILTYYFNGLLSEKGKTIGILLSNGISKSDILAVFTLIFTLFSLFAIICQFGINALLLYIVNSIFIQRGYTDYPIYFFRWYTPFILIAICIVVFALGILLPAIHLYRQKSINLLREE